MGLSLDVKTYSGARVSGCNPDDAFSAESADRRDVEGA